MKYDSGMTYLNKDILAAVRLMCRNSFAEMSEKFSLNDGPPAPVTLRNYLKEKYGKTHYNMHSGNVYFSCNSNNMEIKFSTQKLNNLGETVLTMTWTQAAKFIKDSWGELFEEAKPKPTYSDVLLEHYQNFDEEMFDEFVTDECICNFFDDNGKKKECYNGNRPKSCEECWKSECQYPWKLTDDGKADIIHYLTEADESAKTADLPSPLIPANAEEIASAFNYAVLSTEMGDYLKRKEQQLKNEYMNFTANCGAIFAEAQEKLAGDNHYNGLFLKWIESMGFKKSAVYRMIDVHKFYSSQIGKSKQELFAELPKSLQYEISAKSAPPELVEQVMNGDITTHAEFIKLKKELEKEREKAEHAEDRLRAKSATISELSEENVRLEREIKELENRPIDVETIPEEEIERRAAEMSKNIIRSKEIEFDNRLQDMQTENRKLKKELENRPTDNGLDDCFEKPGDIPAREILEFYETLHGNAISAIKDCARFIKDKIPNSFKEDAKSRFEMLEELFEDYKKELEE